MAFEIILKKRFLNKLTKTLAYLEQEWSHEVAATFLKIIERRIEQLSQQPYLGVPSQKIKNVRGVLITKHNRMYYKIKGDYVFILNMYDTRMNPSKNPY